MTSAGYERLRQIRSFPQLVTYLRDDLGWPIESEDFEDLTYEYVPEELGLDEAAAVKVRKIHQLRPLVSDQPWGIFFLDFEPKRLPVVVLRKILSALVVKKRRTAAQAQRASWRLHDLLFISSYGEDEHRDITFAHFAEDPGSSDRPALRVLGWDDENTVRHLDHANRVLSEKLHWPSDDQDPADWRRDWAEAFLGHREVIKTSKALAERLAELAKSIRKRVNAILAVESDRGAFRKLMAAFKEALIHDLTADDFADAYAQTITYGLLAARVSRPAELVAENITDMVPSTNPFLRDLLATFLKAGGRRGKLDFDEVGVNDVVELLRAKETNMEAVLRDFGDRNPQEDPVIHFYELFLKEYDRKKRVKRGVFFTPRPVVSFIVQSVDEILRTEFGLEDGLADTTTWGEMVKRHPDLELPEGAKGDDSFVRILDPACGTGTFLVEVIDLIHQTMLAKWRKQGRLELELPGLWNDYVSEHLLPRLYGFELMMAPYAIAHMKIGLKLAETGYRFGSSERARIYLTNSLEAPQEFAQRILLDVPALAHEAQAVNAVKRHQWFAVVMGNPPYSASVSEPAWLMDSLEEWKRDLNETKIDVNREEWKFLRYGQVICDQLPIGVLGLVINRDCLDGVAKRRMRDSLQRSFPYRTVIDLNGDLRGSVADENVFEITQGVCILVLCRRGGTEHRFFSLTGTRREKYSMLSDRAQLNQHLEAFEPTPPYYRWVPFTGQAHGDMEREYSRWLPLNEVFRVYSSGIQTKRDSLCVHFDERGLWTTVRRFHSVGVATARQEFGLKDDGRDWTVASAKADIAASGPNRRHIVRILYRPFDVRYTYWTGKTKGFLAYPRRDVMRHVIGHPNIGMIFNRQVVGDCVSHFGVSRVPICHGTFYLGNKGQDYFAPLFVVAEQDLLSHETSPLKANFTPTLWAALSQVLGTRAKGLTAAEVFHYAYAVLHSPDYRGRYRELLKIDFPRLPLTGNLTLFRALARLGEELVALHLLESPKVDDFTTTYAGPKDPGVGRVGWSDETVWLDAAATKRDRAVKPGTIGFCSVPEVVWDFHIGGYQVCHKWLKDRRGRVLTDEDITHYQKIIVAISETIRLMAEIDKVIEEHGGWPDAFVTTSEPGEASG